MTGGLAAAHAGARRRCRPGPARRADAPRPRPGSRARAPPPSPPRVRGRRAARGRWPSVAGAPARRRARRRGGPPGAGAPGGGRGPVRGGTGRRPPGRRGSHSSAPAPGPHRLTARGSAGGAPALPLGRAQRPRPPARRTGTRRAGARPAGRGALREPRGTALAAGGGGRDPRPARSPRQRWHGGRASRPVAACMRRSSPRASRPPAAPAAGPPAPSTASAPARSAGSRAGWTRPRRRCCAAWSWARTSGSPSPCGRTSGGPGWPTSWRSAGRTSCSWRSWRCRLPRSWACPCAPGCSRSSRWSVPTCRSRAVVRRSSGRA